MSVDPPLSTTERQNGESKSATKYKANKLFMTYDESLQSDIETIFATRHLKPEGP